jgi:hypothetical protein
MDPLNEPKEGHIEPKPEWIPGIYNYCDRWCERCAFTSRCRSFAMEFSIKEGSPVQINDQQWDRQHPGNEELEQSARTHELAGEAWKYSQLTESWMKRNEDMVTGKITELKNQVRLEAGAKRAQTESELIEDALQIIRWYEPQIWVKLMRALTGRRRAHGQELIPKDSDGSAKVALIGMDRSLEAWEQLHFLFPDETNEFITLLLELDRLRKKTEMEFPEARSFKRIGFDEELKQDI